MTAPDRLPSLYEHADEFVEIVKFTPDTESPDNVNRTTGEVMTDEELLARFDAADGSTEKKLARCAAVQLDAESEKKRWQKRGDELKAQCLDAAERIAAGIDRLDRLMLLVVKRREEAAKAIGKKVKRAVETPFGPVSYRAESKVVVDEAVLPRDLYYQPPTPKPRTPPMKPDKKRIKEAIKNGEAVAGARLVDTVTRPKLDSDEPEAIDGDDETKAVTGG